MLVFRENNRSITVRFWGVMVILFGVCVLISYADTQAPKYAVSDLIQAARASNIERLKKIISADININATDKLGRTALDYAKEWKRQNVLKILQEAMPKKTIKKTNQFF